MCERERKERKRKSEVKSLSQREEGEGGWESVDIPGEKCTPVKIVIRCITVT